MDVVCPFGELTAGNFKQPRNVPRILKVSVDDIDLVSRNHHDHLQQTVPSSSVSVQDQLYDFIYKPGNHRAPNTTELGTMSSQAQAFKDEIRKQAAMENARHLVEV